MNNKTKAELIEIIERLKRDNDKIPNLKKQVKALTDQSKVQVSQIKNLKGKVEPLEKSNSHLTRLSSEYKQTNENLHDQIVEYREDLKSLNERKRYFEKLVDSLKATLVDFIQKDINK